MVDYADLEIYLYPHDDESYVVEMRYNDPDEEELRPLKRGAASFDWVELRMKQLQPNQYGAELTSNFFADGGLLDYYEKVLVAVESKEKTLRLRLFIDRSAGELHNLRWETLRDPHDGKWLLSKPKIHFSRFLSSDNWGRVRLRPKKKIRVLVTISNPSDLADDKFSFEYTEGGVDQKHTLKKILVDDELKRAQNSLEGIEIVPLVSDPNDPGRTELKNLTKKLDEGYDILYLVCHGGLIKKPGPGVTLSDTILVPHLWLEKENGKADVIPGTALVEKIANLPASRRPLLVVLASCESAGTGKTSDVQGALAALGPQLAQAGVPAVLAMQGKINMSTIAELMPSFFSKLKNNGRIDQALAEARNLASDGTDQDDTWMPVLYLRLRGGRLWYTPAFAGDQSKLKKWNSLLTYIEDKACTPILGPGITENLLGSRRELAIEWAEAHNFPLADHNRENLPQVAQFLATDQALDIPHRWFRRHHKDHILSPKDVPDEWKTLSPEELISEAGRRLRQANENDPHTVLARLESPIYISTTPDPLLYDALKERGKEPTELICRWRPDENPEKYQFPEPDKDHPLIFYLFGHIREPDSLVLTEDNYFDFLIGVTREAKPERQRIPTKIQAALTSTSLLFLGFRLDDWNFRVLFRSIINQEGSAQLKRKAHIAVQVDPEDDRIREPSRARSYLEDYFISQEIPADISIYWGRVEDFIKELNQRLD